MIFTRPIYGVIPTELSWDHVREKRARDDGLKPPYPSSGSATDLSNHFTELFDQKKTVVMPVAAEVKPGQLLCINTR